VDLRCSVSQSDIDGETVMTGSFNFSENAAKTNKMLLANYYQKVQFNGM
jgi:hypothetical protein